MMTPTSTDAEGTLCLGGVSVQELAERYGTPVFAYDAGSVHRQIHNLRATLRYRPLEIYYSVKANPALGILQLLRNLGSRADVCSLGDVAYAAAAGFADRELSFTGCGLTESELDAVAARPDIALVADSLVQLEYVVTRFPGRSIGLRVNPGIDAGFHPHVRAGSGSSRFGLGDEEMDTALEMAGRHGCPVVGLHGHLGSDIFDSDPFLQLASRLCALSDMLPTVRWLNLGGGLGIPRDHPDDVEFGKLDDGLSQLLTRVNRSRAESLRLRIEPGSYLTMDSGLLIARVTDLKAKVLGSHDGTVCVDASSNLLVSAVIYNTHHPIFVCDRPEADATHTYDIAGNLMQAGDILARDRALPEVRVGDLLAFGRCGAYSASRSTTFNNRGRPAEVLISDGAARLIRRREEPLDLLRFEI